MALKKLGGSPVEVCEGLGEGRMQGFAADGTLVVDMEFQPVFKYIVGDKNTEIAVTRWKVSPGYARRVAALAAWQMHDYACREGMQ